MYRTILTFIILCILFVGCVKYPHTGYIVDKQFYPQHEEMHLQMIPSGDSFIYVPIWYTVPDQYVVRYKDEEGSIRSFYSNASLFDDIKPGQKITNYGDKVIVE